MPIEIGRAGVWPSGYFLSSGKRTESGIIFSTSGVVGGVLVRTDGTNDVTITLNNDPAVASGDILLDILVPGADKIGGVIFGTTPIYASVGCYLTISGTGGSCIVYFRN